MKEHNIVESAKFMIKICIYMKMRKFENFLYKLKTFQFMCKLLLFGTYELQNITLFNREQKQQYIT